MFGSSEGQALFERQFGGNARTKPLEQFTALDFELSGQTAEMIDTFVAQIRPKLEGKEKTDWLFPSGADRSRRSTHASQAIALVVEKYLGIRITAHQFRHAAAAMALKQDPGNYEYLLVRNVPYVDPSQAILFGILISRLELSGDRTNKPTDHVAFWTGAHPCHSDGSKITSIQNSSAAQDFGDGVRADHTFSAKADYRDYYHKMTTYIARITGEATKLDEHVSARTFPAIRADDESCVFRYVDTATSRAGIGAVNGRIAGQKVGILGLGGTGAYILDSVAKNAVAEIHLIDGDVFSQHNAFRAPGAPSIEELEARPQKVAYFAERYSKMHKGIVAHDTYLDETNLSLLEGLDFVFICLDRGPVKRAIVERLVELEIAFVEVGMGVLLDDGQLGGIVRLTTSTPETRELAAPHISYADDDGGANEYATNIQIAELNSFNASIAVMRWKQIYGVYRDARKNFYTGFSIGSGEIVQEGAG